MTDDGPPGPDIEIAPNYRDGCVWITLPPQPRQCIPPALAREIADELEAADADAYDEMGYEIGAFIADIREVANAVETAGGDADAR